MDEEEELDNTLIGQQEEAPSVNTEDGLFGTKINAPEGVGEPSDKVSIPSFGQPAPGLIPALPAMPTVEEVAPAVQSFEDVRIGQTGEQGLINNNPFLPSDSNASVGGNNNSRQVTFADVNNPALDGLSAREMIDAVNAPGYFTPTGPASLNINEPTTSRAKDIQTGLTNLVGGTADMLVAGGKGLVSPFTVGYDYLFNTPNNEKPSFKDSLQKVGEDIAEVKNFPIQSMFTGDINLDEQRSVQNKRVADFLARESQTATQAPPVESALGGTPSVGAQEQSTQSVGIPQGAEGSPQANFANRMSSGEPLTQEEITAANAFAKSMGTTFNPETGYSRDAFLGSQPTSPRSDTFPNDPGVQRTRDELMSRFGAPTIREIQEQDAIRAGRQAGTNLTPAPAVVNNFAPQAPSGQAGPTSSGSGTPAPFPNTEGREIRDALFRGDSGSNVRPLLSDPGFIQQPSLRDPDPGFTPRPPSLRDPDAGFIRPAPNLSDFERESLAREARLVARPNFNEAISDRDRRAARSEGLSQADARDLAQGMDPNASEGERMRALQIQSRLGLGDFEPEEELTDLEKREIESRISEREEDIAASRRKGGFEPRVIDVGGEKAMELSPGYFQRIAKDKPNKTGLQTTLENLQADLDSGRLTQEQYDIAVKNAKNIYIGNKAPKQNEIDVQNEIDALKEEKMGATPAEGNDASDIESFATEAEAKASGVKGEVLIGGRRAVIE